MKQHFYEMLCLISESAKAEKTAKLMNQTKHICWPIQKYDEQKKIAKMYLFTYIYIYIRISHPLNLLLDNSYSAMNETLNCKKPT